ncbi:MAG: AAA family ATPase [Zestosphaera tikiterensis]|uniref:AAA family ATPase n=1 Tax=Zestosphaera tikiterensis TaxID=1973259 RepID=A0A2R7Y6H9_9CREN|nr:MAG: AAA family ATPase [Zestosphaera tikiterensis]
MEGDRTIKHKEYVLRVVEARKNEALRGKVRIPERVLAKIDAEVGDVIEIVGRRSTAAIAWPALPEEEDKDIIRMDGILRKNANVSIGDKVIVRQATVREAAVVKIAPGEQTIQLSRSESSLKAVKKRLLDYVLMEGDIVPLQLLGSVTYLYVVQTRPSGPVILTDETQLIIVDKSPTTFRMPRVTYEDIGGMKEVIERVRELVELPLKHPELFKKLGIEPPKGILLYGPPGCGKTLLAKAVAAESDAYFIAINGPEIMSKYYGESEQRLREIFDEARKNAPAIIFIDEIDAIAPKREEVVGEVEKRVVAQLLTLMDGLEGRGDIVVIGATNRVHAVDPALRRPGRFDREIEIPMPDKQGRLEILQIHSRNVPLSEDVSLEKIAEVTHGFTGADLAALVKEAALNALRRVLPKINLDEEIPPEIYDSLKVSMNDFIQALKVINPSGLREFLVEIPEVRWDDIGGLESVKQELRETVEWPLKYPEGFSRLGIEPPKGILLYGPPGCGKTLLAKAVATESGANFIAIKGPEILSKWVGESEKAIREIFRKARTYAPAVVFFDEIDALAPVRGFAADSYVSERVVSQLLTELDSVERLNRVVVVAATNRPDLVDPALLRPGRIEKLVYVPPPDFRTRLEILKVHTRRTPLDVDVDLEELARATEGFSGADLAALVREAALNALREDINASKVKAKHFKEALAKVTPSLTPEIVKFFESWVLKTKQRLPKSVSHPYQI